MKQFLDVNPIYNYSIQPIMIPIYLHTQNDGKCPSIIKYQSKIYDNGESEDIILTYYDENLNKIFNYMFLSFNTEYGVDNFITIDATNYAV